MNTTDSHIPPDVSIIIPTKDRHNSMLRTLKAVLSDVPDDCKVEIVVIEETNKPQPIEDKSVRYYSIPERGFGFGFARNFGLRKASGTIVVFLDDDIKPAENWLENLLAPFKDSNIGAVGGAILPDLIEINTVGKCISFLGFPAGGLKRYVEANGQNCETVLISTGNCAFQADVAREIGGFDVLLRWGGEDQDFFERMASVSKTLFVPEAIVFHRQRDVLKQLFFWFIRRGKAEFYRRSKVAHPLSSLIFPLRSNFWLKIVGFFVAFLGLYAVSGFAALGFAVCVLIFWNALLWYRGYRVLVGGQNLELSDKIEKIRKTILCKQVSLSLFFVKFIMDMGQEIGKSVGFCRYLNHRIFSKPLVLTFHHLATPEFGANASNSKYYFPKENFEKIVRDSEKQDRLVVSLSEMIKRLKENSNTLYFEKILAVTFDDGYLSIFETLRELGGERNYPFTVFIPTFLVGDMNRWDELKGLKQEKIMSWAQIKELRTKGIEIGSHTRNHINLRDSTDAVKRVEIAQSLVDLRSNLSNSFSNIIFFSYPYGAYDEGIIQMVKEAGYVGAVTNVPGNIRSKTDPWQLPRFSVYSDSEWASISHQSRSLWAKELVKDLRDWLFCRQR